MSEIQAGPCSGLMLKMISTQLIQTGTTSATSPSPSVAPISTRPSPSDWRVTSEAGLMWTSCQWPREDLTSPGDHHEWPGPGHHTAMQWARWWEPRGQCTTCCYKTRLLMPMLLVSTTIIRRNHFHHFLMQLIEEMILSMLCPSEEIIYWSLQLIIAR